MIRKLATATVIALVVLLIVLQLALGWVFNTERGTRWALRQALPLVPGELHYQRLDGTLLTGIRLGGLSYQLNGLAVQLHELALSLDYYGLPRGWLAFKTLHLDGLAIQLPPAAEKEQPTDPLALPDSLRLPFGIAVLDGRARHSRLTQNGQTHELALVELSDTWMRWRLELGTLAVHYQQHRLQLSGTSELAHPWRLNAEAQWQAQLPATINQYVTDRPDARWHGQAQVSGSLLALDIRHRLHGPVRLDSDITLNPFSQPLGFISRHRFDALTLRLPDGHLLPLSEGDLDLTGEPEDYALSATLSGAYRDFKHARLSLQALGNLQGLRRFSLHLQQPETSLAASGRLQLQPHLLLDTDLDAQHIQLEDFFDGWHSDLALKGHLRATNASSQWALESRELAIDGTLNGTPFALAGSASHHRSTTDLDLNGHWDSNTLALAGQVGEHLNLESHFNLLRPELLHPALRGSLAGRLRLRGTPQAPEVSGDLSSPWLLFQRWKVQQFQAQLNRLGPASDQLYLQLTADGLLQDNQPLLTAPTLSLQGSAEQHRLAAHTETPLGPLALALDGRLDTQAMAWEGAISEFSQQPANLPIWRLQQPAPLTLSQQRVSLTNFCLSDQHGALCTDLGWSPADTSLRVQAHDLSLRPLALLFTTGVQFDGSLHAEANLSQRNGQWQGQAQVTLEEARAFLRDRQHPLSLVTEEARAELTLDNNMAHLSTRLAFVDWGEITGGARLRLDTSTLEQARLQAELVSLDRLQLFIAHLRNPQGSFNATLSAQGPLARPILQGQATLDMASAEIPALGITLTQSQLNLQAENSRLTLSGGLSSGKGRLALAGHLDVAEGFPGQLALQAQGDNLEITHLAEAQITASPRLRIDNQGRRLRVRGEVEVPFARVAPKQLPEVAIKVSKDQVIINQTPAPAGAVDVDVLVSLILGRDVVFEGFGLEAQLSGNVSFAQVPERPFALQGEVRIHEGRYRAYGQNLAIDDGLLFFQDSADNPAIDIRAYRKIPSAGVTVGVALSGTLQQPEARLYSEPPMEESQMMAWLVTGRGLDTGSNSDNAQIAQALALYGLQQGAGVTESLEQKLGLDEISIGSDWENSDASLMLGKQINDRLYLRYAIGLFDAISTVMLRYTLSRRLHLEAQSNIEHQSIDLIYQIER